MRSPLLILLLLACMFCMPALAAPQPEVLKTFGRWTAYRHFEGKDKPVCYIAAPPIISSGKYSKRGPVFLLVTHRPSEKAYNVVSFVSGYDFDEKKPVFAKIDDKNYMMIPAKDMAWTPDQKADDVLAQALRKGNKMMIQGTSSRGTLTKDEFSLKGTSKALEAIDKACKVKK